MAQQQIKGATGSLGSGGALDTYVVPGAVIITPYAVSTVFDGSGASGAFLPCLTFKTQTGAVIARCPAPEVASGDTAEVSWFPHVAQAVSSSGGGIQFDTPNSGDWLEVQATGQGGGDYTGFPLGFAFVSIGGGGQYFWDGDPNNEGATSSGFQINEFGDGGIQITDSYGGPNGGIFIDEEGDGGLSITNEGAGGIKVWDTGTAGVNVKSLHGGIFLNASLITMSDLPTSDPLVSGALWNNGGVLNIS